MKGRWLKLLKTILNNLPEHATSSEFIVPRFELHSVGLKLRTFMQNGKARSITYTTSNYKEYGKDVARQLKDLRKIHADYEYGILLEIQCVNYKVGDNDNVAKGIHDALETGGFIFNDANATHTFQIKTFGHKENKCIVHLWETDYTNNKYKELVKSKVLKRGEKVVIDKSRLIEDGILSV